MSCTMLMTGLVEMRKNVFVTFIKLSFWENFLHTSSTDVRTSSADVDNKFSPIEGPGPE